MNTSKLNCKQKQLWRGWSWEGRRQGFGGSLLLHGYENKH